MVPRVVAAIPPDERFWARVSDVDVEACASTRLLKLAFRAKPRRLGDLGSSVWVALGEVNSRECDF